MKNLLLWLLCVACSFISCSGQKANEYVKNFGKHEPKLIEITQFLELNKDTLLQLGCNEYTKGGLASFDFKSIEKKCYQGFSDTLGYFLKLEIFKTMEISKDGEIEYLLDFSPAKTIVTTETSRYYFYCPNNELPKPYDSWSVQIKLKDHWWYLEHTDAGL